MKTRKLTSAALALMLSAVMAFGLAAPVRAMDFGLSGLDASLATQSFQQQVELSVNLASLQAEAAQSSAQWQAESSLAAAQQELNALQNTPVVSEGGSLNGGLGDPNTIIVSEGGSLNGGLGDPNTIIVSEGGNLNGGLGDPNTIIVSEGGNLNGGTGDINTIIVQGTDGTPVIGGSKVDQYGFLNMNRDTIDSNWGRININNGTVIVNGKSNGSIQAKISLNNGTVNTNYPSSIVPDNNGTVGENSGTVYNNNSGGTVTDNNAGGTVETNRGTVNSNSGTVQTNEQGGTITYNHGTVTVNNGTVKSLSNGTVITNNGTVNLIEQKGVVQTNGANGRIITNKGTVWYNEGEIEKNNLDVWGNAGTITLNNGTVTDNLYLVKENKGTIDANVANAAVEKNIGNINKNYGTVDNYADGIVQMNYGTVFLYGGEVTESGDGGIELFQVTIERSANTSVTDAADGLTAHNGEAWKEEGNISGQATVTISPATGYSITNIAAAEGITPVQNDDGSWTVTVDADLVNAGTFTLDTSVQQNDPPSNYPPDNGGPDPDHYGGYHTDPVYFDDAAYFADILSLLSITMEPTAAATVYNAGPNAYDSFNSERISELSAASENGTVTIDLRSTGWTTLKREVFEAAARRGDVTIVILYQQWGRDCSLTIPAGTDFSALYEAQFLEVSQLPALLHLI